MISRDFFSVANNLGDSVAFNSESDSADVVGASQSGKRGHPAERNQPRAEADVKRYGAAPVTA